MIRAFAKTKIWNAISLFKTMLQADIRPDNYITLRFVLYVHALITLILVCMLRLVHGSYVSAGLGLDPICCTALVSAYSKLGFVHEACRVFNGITEPDLVLWNSLVSAYVCSGMWEIGIQMFSSMRHAGKKPDGFTLAGLLVGIADSSLLSIG
jgi:pentatricopeptide repeat protein